MACLQAFNTNYHDTGLFGVYATANKDDPVDDMAWCIMREISRMCYSPVEEDIIRAKNQLKSAILFSQDNLNGGHLGGAGLPVVLFCSTTSSCEARSIQADFPIACSQRPCPVPFHLAIY